MAWRFHGCQCEPSQEFDRGFRERTIDPAEDSARSREFSRRMQEATRPTAIRFGAPWTPEDADIACDTDVDAAVLLNRTAKAVQTARWRFLNPDLSERQHPQS
ncbi:hypothetical protein [Mycobacteroides abscessus]|uniref:hypothetical protein n=1 Tax=Mycobacteroides abscessus TaxID=36809 RepID=UPI000C259378|nr:hypothetical protein [Mycobacteroides abscessus]